jgi:phosphate starvation-inducible PhoH-like protein
LSEIELTINSVDLFELYGDKDVKLNLIRKASPDLKITSRGEKLKITGDDKKNVQRCKNKIEMMVRCLKKEESISLQDVQEIADGKNPFENRISSRNNDNVIVYRRDGTPIKAKTQNQKLLFESSEANDVVFAIGPAGTGKTYTAVAIAVRALKNRLVKKIILTRPAVEAGENLGFLPGDLKDKVDPYLRPLYDALDDMIPPEKLNQFLTNGTIEVAPLAFMRGRTLDNAFIILDEAQNTTPQQLKMFLTRLGPSAKAIITGDMTQIDLPRHQRSGLAQSVERLGEIDGIGIVKLTASDVVRHRLVKDIIEAYTEIEAKEADTKEKRKAQKEAKKKEEK